MNQSLVITGMGCRHCVGKVTEALEAVPGVISVSVDLTLGRAEVHGDAIVTDLVQAVIAAGYGAEAADRA